MQVPKLQTTRVHDVYMQTNFWINCLTTYEELPGFHHYRNQLIVNYGTEFTTPYTRPGVVLCFEGFCCSVFVVVNSRLFMFLFHFITNILSNRYILYGLKSAAYKFDHSTIFWMFSLMNYYIHYKFYQQFTIANLWIHTCIGN